MNMAVMLSRRALLSLPSLRGNILRRLQPFSSTTRLLNDHDSDDEDRTGRIASKTPFEVSLVPGKKYFWCRCGESKKQPWCDGSHKGTGFTPVKFTVEEEEPEAFLCGCKQTGTKPYCDGTHATPAVLDSP